jgi:hypothetical protein
LSTTHATPSPSAMPSPVLSNVRHRPVGESACAEVNIR